METLLPSEIARLVLGYLYEQKCDDAAKVFLETSPHLQECRTVISHGRRFSTKVSGMTMLDVLEKFAAVNTMIQERLSRISDCEQLKHCGDLLEQLKYIVEEPRGQRFVVNINVPTQANAQACNNSPIISSSLRKRRYSNNERERNKRHKTPCSIPELSESPMNQVTLDALEATPLETLPGHVQSQKEIEQVDMPQTKNSSPLLEQQPVSRHTDQGTSMDISLNIESNDKSNSKKKCNKHTSDGVTDTASSSKAEDPPRKNTSLKKCTTSTSTEELLSFSCAEVQTMPYDTPESESETNDEPIENLSLLTKELLNRTELQERIAENINKAILPMDVSKDDTLNASGACEANTSIMTELTHAIKSIVEATESDPVFEHFLDEIIGPYNEAETSPDEEPGMQTAAASPNGSQGEKSEVIKKTIESFECAIDNTDAGDEVQILDEIPIKLSVGSTIRLEKHCEEEIEQRSLEDQNAAAIMSIIAANIINSDEKPNTETVPLISETIENRKSTINSDSILKEALTDNNNTNGVSKKTTNTVRRIRPTRIKRDPPLNTNEFISEQDILTMPTLILCSKNEINNMISTTTESPRFVPITPMPGPESAKKFQTKNSECIYLRTVQVPQKASLPSIAPNISVIAPKQRKSAGEIRTVNVQTQQTTSAVATVSTPTFSLPLSMALPVPVSVPLPITLTMPVPMPSISLPLSTPAPTSVPMHVPVPASASAPARALAPTPLPTPVPAQPVCKVDSTTEITNKANGIEGITLYATEITAKTTLNNTDVPMINVEETISLSATGLSPYLKFSSNKTNPNYSLSEIELTAVSEQAKTATLPKIAAVTESDPSTSKSDVITKRTPRTLLKSRSKNHRLSLSTPRRSSHIRALDFNTPAKRLPNRSASENEAEGISPKPLKHVKSVCSLFKSPPGVNNILPSTQIKSPKQYTRKVPIASRSPRPKLTGGWEKNNGVGVIIDVASTEEDAKNASSEPINNESILKRKVPTGNWDADLRKVLQTATEQKGKQSENSAKTTSKSRKGIGTQNKVRVSSVKQTKKTPIKKSQGSEATAKFCRKPSTSTRDSQNKPMSEVKQDIPKKGASIMSRTKNHNSPGKSGHKNVKKYAQLKTIKTNLKDKKEIAKGDNVEDKRVKPQTQCVTQTAAFQKLAIEINPQMLPLSDMVDLETPRKFHNACGVPPTPRLLSPNSNTITPFVKTSDDSSKMRSIISTPEFPTTPCVTFTPQHIQESTQDNAKKDEYVSCSPYYKPSCKKEENIEKLAKAASANSQSSSKPSLSIGSVEISSHQTYASARLEITQFEVIKENLPKEEAVKELKISTTSREACSDSQLQLHCSQIEIRQHTMKNALQDITDCNPASKVDNKSLRTNAMEVESLHNDPEGKDDDDDASSSNSDTSDSESTTSSSSSGSSTTNVSSYSQELTPYSKTRRPGGKLDIINNSSQRTARVTRSTVNEAARNAQLEALKMKLNTATDRDAVVSKVTKNTGTIDAKHPHEVSPTKVFSITKTDEQLDADMKETPAKDETLLDEADISETPSSSKSGVVNLTNLSTKISAIIGSEGKLESSKAMGSTLTEKSTEDKVKQKPRVLSVQPVNSNINIVPVACTINKEQTSTETGNRPFCVDDKLIGQLEAKRQRLIAKFREGAQTNVTRGRGNRRRTACRGRRAGVNGLRRTCHPVAPPGPYNCTQYVNGNLVLEKNLGPNNNNTIVSSMEDGKKIISGENTHLNTMCHLDNLNYENVSSADENPEKTPDGIPKAMVDCKSQDTHFEQDESKASCSAGHLQNPSNEVIGEDVHSRQDQNADPAKTINESVPQKNVTSESIKHTSAESLSRVDQPNYLLKSKVDQVKRDLFSDEENEHRESLLSKSRNASEKSDANKTAGSDKPKTMSHVLECLELVPTSKNDEIDKMEEDDDDIDDCIDTSFTNYVEYNFIYDDNAPTKRRRRRYSNRDLEFHANIILSQEDNRECFKLMTPTDLEEIFNMSPKLKKRLPSKKPEKNVKPLANNDCNLTPCTSINTCKILEAKPLATSSPVEKPNRQRTKKVPCKKPIKIEKIKDNKVSVRKRIKPDTIQETDKDNQDKKGRKRKLSETIESSQAEKKQNTTNPQLLLCNLDVDKFLTTVHGPE